MADADDPTIGTRMRRSARSGMLRRAAAIASGVAFAALLAIPTPIRAARLKDMASVKGVRTNQIIGYGLVVGLNDTGDRQQTRFTQRSLLSLLAKMGVAIDEDQIRVSNVAAVMVTAKLPPFARAGGRIDAVVSSIGDAESLKGGTLLMTPLVGVDGEIYAIAQGALSVGGFSVQGGGSSVSQNHPTVASLVGGAIVEREVGYSLVGKREFEIALHEPDFTTAQRAASRINQVFAADIAQARDSGTLDLSVPEALTEDLVGFMARVESIEIVPDTLARIVLNERTGTIVMGDAVRVSTVAVSHGNLTVIVNRTNQISQPAPFSEGETARLQNTDIEASGALAAEVEMM